MRKHFTKSIHSVVIKIGTSVLTKSGRFDKKILARLSADLARILKKGIRVYIVSSGAIGSGMTILNLKTRPKTMQALQAAAAVGQRYLMQCYEEAFSKHGFSTAQVLLTWDDLARAKRFVNAKRTLPQIQKWGLVPIINENDTVATDEIRFGDNDRLSSLLSILVEADVLVILSDTDGLYEGAALGKSRHRIKIVQEMADSVFSHVRDNRSSFTVGGMRSKLSAIRMSVNAGIPVFLANGRQARVLTRIFNGEDIGTLFVPKVGRGQAKKNWIKYFTDHVRPLLRLNAGAIK